MDPVDPLAQPKECVGRTRPSFQGMVTVSDDVMLKEGGGSHRGYFMDEV